MKKTIILLSLSFLFVNGSCESSAQDKKKGPLISEEAIFDSISKEYDGLDKNDLCIEDISELNHLFVVGFFAYDRGCALERMFYNGYEIKGDHSDANKVLIDNGFEENKTKLVETYHKEVILVFKGIVNESNEDFVKSDVTFTPPNTWKEGNQIISQIWTQNPSGMIPETSYYLSTLVFDLDGNFVSLSKKQNFTVSID